MLEEVMEDSESQTLHPLESVSTSVTRPTKADLLMREGNLLEASSREHKKSSSPSSKSGRDIDVGVRGDCSEFDSLDSDFELFFAFDGISPLLQGSGGTQIL